MPWLLLAILAGCNAEPKEPATALDHCALREYVQECVLADAPEQAECRRKALKEAVRVVGGISQECRT